jgi:hypothetical protein
MEQDRVNALTSLAIDLVIKVPLLIGEVKAEKLRLYKTLYDKNGKLIVR